jgi:DHA1 family bicyclomycin/chloramphenicol resistance-like MFS transporter
VSLVPRSVGYVALLVALGSFGPLTMSIYTPVMPSVGADLSAGAESVKLTLTTYMLGFAVGQLFYGPLSDRYRRPVPLVGGASFFIATTLACPPRPSIGSLILRLWTGPPGGAESRSHARCLQRPRDAGGDELIRSA